MVKDSKVYNIQLQIDSQLEHVRLLSSALRGIGHELEINSEQVGQLELILVEAVNNVIEHAYELQTGNVIKVRVECTPDNRIKLIISDQGKSMPETTPQVLNNGDPDFPEPEQLPESGWGMGLIRMLADSCRYEHKNNHNHWHIVKHLA